MTKDFFYFILHFCNYHWQLRQWVFRINRLIWWRCAAAAVNAVWVSALKMRFQHRFCYNMWIVNENEFDIGSYWGYNWRTCIYTWWNVCQTVLTGIALHFNSLFDVLMFRCDFSISTSDPSTKPTHHHRLCTELFLPLHWNYSKYLQVTSPYVFNEAAKVWNGIAYIHLHRKSIL